LVDTDSTGRVVTSARRHRRDLRFDYAAAAYLRQNQPLSPAIAKPARRLVNPFGGDLTDDGSELILGTLSIEKGVRWTVCR
jgi:hypothetical protein